MNTPTPQGKGQAMKAYGYIRVSSVEQIKGTSLASQTREIRAYAELKGIELVDVIIDPAIKGEIPIGDRPQGRRLVEAIEAKTIDTVIICKLDRAFRSASDCLSRVEEWERKGISLHIINYAGQVVDTSNPMGKLWLTLMAGFAEFEKNLIKERCSNGRASRKAEGKATGGTPFGYKKDANNYLIPNEAEQAIITEIKAMSDKGFSLNHISKSLNQRGVSTKNGGGKWAPAQISRILKAA